jgi:Ser/Thr protein kinase RdoA (MazF antagonist)
MTDGPIHVEHAARQFAAPRAVAAVERHGNGNVHDTFLVTLGGAKGGRFILQRVNTHVFREPRNVMSNILAVSEHIEKRLHQSAVLMGRRWDQVRVLRTLSGDDHWLDPDGAFWRALSFVEGARAFDTLRNADHAREVGCALGLFHALIADLPCDALFDTLEGFHVTPRYLDHFDNVLASRGAPSSPEMAYALTCVEDRRKGASVIEDARSAGLLAPRPIHGDPKVGNMMIDIETGRAVSIVDLDTVKPGLIHYDIGDCLRSGCNASGELPDRLEAVTFDMTLCRTILDGYLSFAGGILSRAGMEVIYDAVRLITFELGLRFLTDYLEGNRYFKTRFPGQNLKRALAQFKLCESIESREPVIRALVRELA